MFISEDSQGASVSLTFPPLEAVSFCDPCPLAPSSKAATLVQVLLVLTTHHSALLSDFPLSHINPL